MCYGNLRTQKSETAHVSTGLNHEIPELCVGF